MLRPSRGKWDEAEVAKQWSGGEGGAEKLEREYKKSGSGNLEGEAEGQSAGERDKSGGWWWRWPAAGGEEHREREIKEWEVGEREGRRGRVP